MPLRRENEADDDEGEANADVHEGTEIAHDRDTRAGQVEQHDVDEAHEEAGHHRGGQPAR